MVNADFLPHNSSSLSLPDGFDARLKREERRVGNKVGDQRKVLVLGGGGYVGGPVITELLRCGYQVRCADIFVYGHEVTSLGFLLHPNYEFMFADMASREDLDRALDGVTDVIILAGLVGDPITKKFPDESHVINDIGMTNCIQHLNGRNLNKVIFVSTCSNYGAISDDVTADETFELKPLSLYARSKVAAEQYIASLSGAVDYHPTILRFATAFGMAPRMRFDLTVNEFARELYLKRELDVYDATTWRPYCHVKDFAALMARVLVFPVEDVAFEIFNAGSDANNHTKQQIVDMIAARIPDARINYRQNSTDFRNYRVNFEKLRKRLYFEPRYSVSDGIDEILLALANHLFDGSDQQRNLYGNYEVLYQASRGHLGRNGMTAGAGPS